MRLELIAYASAHGPGNTNVKPTLEALKDLESVTGKVLSATQFSQNVPQFLRAVE